jgi:glucose/arabinose dehydrogenase
MRLKERLARARYNVSRMSWRAILVESVERRLLLANLLPNFADALVAGSLTQPVAIDFSPDGRIFVTEKAGSVRVIKDGQLLATPFVTVDVSSSGERGLLGITLDPDFQQNHFVYVYYTATTPSVHNRVSRFTAAGDVAAAGSETVLLELDPLSSATNHNGGAIHFGADGKLYVAQGENANAPQAQTLANRFGKILRINADGSIPSDNPFFTSAAGDNRSIWALGLRNPFTFAVHRGSGRMFINDVGGSLFEEVNEGAAGANYGWPNQEGPASGDPTFTPANFFYNRQTGAPQGTAITGAAFYDGPVKTFPAEYADDYFFSDLGGRFIWTLDAQSGAAAQFATDIGPAVDIKAGADGSLYYVAYNSGQVRKISFVEPGPAPTQILAQPASLAVPAGQPATFSVQASGDNLGYQWTRNGANISGATSASYTLSPATPADNGAQFRVVISGDGGTVTSNAATLTVTSVGVTPPVILTPPASLAVVVGQPATFSVVAQGEQLTYQWLRDDVAIEGATGSSFTLPTTTAADNGAQFRVTVTSAGAASVTSDAALLSVTQAGAAPTVISAQPASVTVRLGEPAAFSVEASGEALAYQWQRNGVDIAGANAASYSLETTSEVDHGAVFRVIVTGTGGTLTSDAATLVVDQNTPPTGVITSPAVGRLFKGGQSIRFKGTGSDAEDRRLSPASFSWRVDLRRGGQIEPVVPQTPGVRGGSFKVPRDGLTSADAFYRIHLTVTDSAGRSAETVRDVEPRVVTINVAGTPPGVQVRLDGAAMTAPFSFQAIVGTRRTLVADPVQIVDGVGYSFVKWSQKRKPELDLIVPGRDRTIEFVYAPAVI